MTAENRNARVVVALIGSLTIGASVLLWMEPRSVPLESGDRSPLLMAATAGEQLSIAYARTLAGVDPVQFDGVIRPDGQWEPWQARGPHVRLLLVGNGGEELTQPQKQTLLDVLRWFGKHRGLLTASLEPSANARETRDLPGEVRELEKFLTARGFLQ